MSFYKRWRERAGGSDLAVGVHRYSKAIMPLSRRDSNIYFLRSMILGFDAYHI